MGFPAQAFNHVINAHATNDQRAKDSINEIVDFVGQMPALNFSNHSASLGDIRSAFYDSSSGTWYVVGANKNARMSTDNGRTWSTSVLTGIGPGTETCEGGAGDGLGNIVIGTRDRYVFARVSGTWSRVDAHGSEGDAGLGTVYASRVIRHPLIWVAVESISNGGTEMRIAASTTGTSWTSRVKPVGFAAGAIAIDVNSTSGRIVFANHDRASNTLRVSYSDDGSASWSTPVVLAHGTSSGGAPYDALTSVAHCPNTNTWLLITGETTVTPACAVFRSTDDGVTWTQVAGLTTACIRNPVAFGPLWIAMAQLASTVHEVVYSIDDGATWQRAGVRLPGGSQPNGVARGGGGALIHTQSDVMLSLRSGLPDAGTLS